MRLSIVRLCMKVGMSRQNYYKSRKLRQRRQVDEQLIRSLVQSERAVQPRLGGLKLHSILRSELESAGLMIGRDRFFEVLRNQGLLLKPLPRSPRTTRSQHSLPVFSNEIRDWKPTGCHQVWVSDITYLRTVEGFVYLSLITDMYSRKIVGYQLARSLETQGTLQALEKALHELPDGHRPIHHSDRGSQYCCHDYVNRLEERGLSISMTETNHCAENSLAERVNGILKQEYYLKQEYQNFQQALKAVDEAVYLYNNHRPHRSLNLRTPEQVHRDAA